MAHVLPTSVRSSDAELASRVLAGDKAAFAQIVDRYQNRLFNVILRITGCSFEAEDALQDTFIQVYRNLARFRGESALYTWLYRLAVNQALTRRRRRKPTVSLNSESDRQFHEPSDPGELPEERMARSEDRERLPRLLARLKDEYRVVLVLREVEEMKYEEIARVLGINPGTVRTRLHRARMALRDLLATLP